MPQLDASTFLSQVTWICLVFVLFYLLVLKNVLPTLFRILKMRSRKTSQGGSSLQAFSQEAMEKNSRHASLRSSSTELCSLELVKRASLPTPALIPATSASPLLQGQARLAAQSTLLTRL